MTADVRLRRVAARKPEQWSEQGFQTVLARVAREGVIQAREVCISEEHLELLLQAAPRNEKDLKRPELQRVVFSRVTFAGDANFAGVTFAGDVYFSDVTLAGDANFRGVTFSKIVEFRDALVNGGIDLSVTRFVQERELGPMLVRKSCDLSGAVFESRAVVKIEAEDILLRRTVFERGADVFVRRASISLDEADFAEPSLVTEVVPVARSILDHEGTPFDEGWVCGLSGGGKQSVSLSPRVVSVRRAKVAQLTVSGLDLSACRFAGAHGLDRLRVERARFAQPPEPKRRLARRRWTRRQTIAEEHHWRSDPSNDAQGWYGAQVRPPKWLQDTEKPPDPGQIAAVYRALRKGFEDSRDEPGAGDFYYGEMEMRRAAASTTAGGDRCATSLGERLVLWLYWLVAGYGLRTSRALIALAVTILIAAIPLAQWGIEPPRTSTNVAGRLSTQPPGRKLTVSRESKSDSPSYGRAVLFATESSISLLRAPEANLTASGQTIEIALRILGPLFFGLAILSLRSRVKR